jgi:hypothetical protein
MEGTLWNIDGTICFMQIYTQLIVSGQRKNLIQEMNFNEANLWLFLNKTPVHPMDH